MTKTIFLSGSTDGIGLEAAKKLAGLGHNLILHGRNRAKLDQALEQVVSVNASGRIKGYLSDFSRHDDVTNLATRLRDNFGHLDILVNNAGIFRTNSPITKDGIDVRFMVNAIAPVMLCQLLLPLLPKDGRIINLSSAAQAPVDIKAMDGRTQLEPLPAYAQSKLALTMWSHHMARIHPQGPVFVAINPGSLLATKMVREGFGTEGNDISIGVDALVQAAVAESFAPMSGHYFDNDAGRFGPPHADALDAEKCAIVVQAIERIIKRLAS